MSFGGAVYTLVEVVKTLIDIIPLEERLGGFNNLACTLGNKGYPLHKVVKHGGSLDLVKLLIEIDSDKNALHMKDTVARIGLSSTVTHSVIFTLIENKDKHQPQAFSDTLRYLVLMISDFDNSPLIKLGDNNRDSPLSKFWIRLGGNISLDYSHSPLSNDDFFFLLKATCYHYLHLQLMILGLRGIIKEREILTVYLWPKHLQYVAQD